MRFTLTLIIFCSFLLSSCIYRTVYDDGFMETKSPLIGKKRYHIFTYYYPDSILNRKVHIFEKYDKEIQGYEEYNYKEETFDRDTPYIAPIDTLPISSPEILEATFHRVFFLPQSITFKDSSKFYLYGEGMSTCTMTPKYHIHGKYTLEDSVLTLYSQLDGSLDIDTTIYTYTNDSIIQTSTTNKTFCEKLILKNW